MVVQELRGQFQLSLLLKTAGISKQIYYYEIKHINDKNKKDKFYEDLILEIFHNNYSYNVVVQGHLFKIGQFYLFVLCRVKFIREQEKTELLYSAYKCLIALMIFLFLP